jgi:hypothetical protein
MKKLLVAVGAALLLIVLSAGAVVIHARRAPTPLLASLAEQSRAPEGVRVRVQVLNTTTTRGLARRATRLLRDRGFDVVEIGNVSPTIDTTIVLDLSGHPEWAEAAAQVMAPARTRARRDSSRYLDVTVLIGRTWRPPAEPLYP